MSQYYVIRSNSYNDELYHYGVKGMKWGVRKAVSNAKGYIKKKRFQAADEGTRLAEYKKQRAKLDFDYQSNELKIKRAQSSKHFARIKDAIFDTRMDTLETKLSRTNAQNDYTIARMKAVKEPSYKRSEEYRKVRRDAYMAYAGDVVDALLYS